MLGLLRALDVRLTREERRQATGAGAGGGGGGPTDEHIMDLIASFLLAGTNITLTHNDAGDSLTIASTASGLDAEGVMDLLNTFLVAGAGIALTYDDVANTLTIAATGGGAIDEVWIGPDDPIPTQGTTFELWVDTDDLGTAAPASVQAMIDAAIAPLPRGIIGYSRLTTTFTTVAPHTTLQPSGLEVTLDEPVGRNLRITGRVNLALAGGTPGIVVVELQRQGVSIRRWEVPRAPNPEPQNLIAFIDNTVGGAGVTYQLIMGALTNFQVTSYADATLQPRGLVIEDVGAAL